MPWAKSTDRDLVLVSVYYKDWLRRDAPHAWPSGAQGFYGLLYRAPEFILRRTLG